MKPITFERQKTMPQPAEAIANQILDLSNWSDFKGYAMLPGIYSALTKPFLWLISLAFRRAIAAHLDLMANDSPSS